MNKIKVVWICHFSDQIIRRRLTFSKYSSLSIFHRLLHRTYYNADFAIWIPNAIREFEKFEDVDLSIIFPHKGIDKKIQKFDIGGIHYFCFRSEDDNFSSFFMQHVLKKVRTSYVENRLIIKDFVTKIKPDIVHVIGAENPYYSIAALDVPKTIPLIVSAQTLLSEKSFIDDYPIRKNLYNYRSYIEKEIIKRSDYIGSRIKQYRETILKEINPKANFLDITLAVGVDIVNEEVEKEYDFVYFAANINKACAQAIEAFSIVKKKYPNITLNVSGSFTSEYKLFIDKKIDELGVKGSVFFTGSKETHGEVLKQIMKSRFAILPLKVDMISSTIREAMACGLPVVTTLTPSTPKLNEMRESVLLSKRGDCLGMANNMIRLLNESKLANVLKANAYKTVIEEYSNGRFMREWHDNYVNILKRVTNDTAG